MTVRDIVQAAAGAEVDPAWNIENATNSGDKVTVGSVDDRPNQQFFDSSGTRLYFVGTQFDSVHQYTLSVAWDVTTASFVRSKSVQAQDTLPTGLTFKSDGTKMYMTGPSNDSIHEYSLSTAWDISTASLTQSQSIAAQENNVRTMYFKDDGLKFYVVGTQYDSVLQYSLSSAWDISTLSYIDRTSLGVTDPNTITFKSDGTQLYIGVSGTVRQYTLSTPWNTTTITLNQTLSGVSAFTGIFFKDDGLQVYFVRNLDTPSSSIDAWNLS